MKFRFCGSLDVPEWLLTEISTSLSKISAMRLKMLCKQVRVCDGVETDFAKLKNHTKGLEPSEVKGSIAAIHFVLTSSAKYNIDSEVLLAEIQQLGLPKDCSEALVQYYNESKQEIQQSLENGSFRKSKLKDISWRVDHVIASSDEDAKEETGTQVQLILQIDGAPHLPDEPENQEAKNNILAVEMTGEKFDVLFHELSEARQIMRSLK